MNYTCANCGEECVSTWTDEEEREDREQTYPGWEKEEMVLLCEPCYDLVVRKKAANKRAFSPGKAEES